MSLGEALRWSRTHSHHHSEFSGDDSRGGYRPTVSVCVPAREEAATIGPIVQALVAMRERGQLDEVVVVDAASQDGTAELAARAGAIVHQQAALLPEVGPVVGKGDAMWRALSVLRGEIVCYVDADTDAFGDHFVHGLVGPLLRWPQLHFVKASFRRPFRAGGVQMPEGGGRVNDLAARPLLNRFYPELAAVRQPLAGEFAARRRLLERLPFFTGYGVEIGLLIDAYRLVGLDGIAQVDLGVRQNRHQSLSELGPMAYAVLCAVTRRLEEEGRLHDDGHDAFLVAHGDSLTPRNLGLVERPPLACMPTALGARGAGAGPGTARAEPASSR